MRTEVVVAAPVGAVVHGALAGACKVGRLVLFVSGCAGHLRDNAKELFFGYVQVSDSFSVLVSLARHGPSRSCRTSRLSCLLMESLRDASQPTETCLDSVHNLLCWPPVHQQPANPGSSLRSEAYGVPRFRTSW